MNILKSILNILEMFDQKKIKKDEKIVKTHVLKKYHYRRKISNSGKIILREGVQKGCYHEQKTSDLWRR